MKWQRDVEEFHKAFEHPIGDMREPKFSRPELRKRLIAEEATETCEAIGRGDMVETIDGLCDLLYVTIGAAVEFGIDLEPFFAEVHRSNMAKVGGGKDEHGKSLKPSGWTPPQIRGVLARQVQEATKAAMDQEAREAWLRRKEQEAANAVPASVRAWRFHRKLVLDAITAAGPFGISQAELIRTVDLDAGAIQSVLDTLREGRVIKAERRPADTSASIETYYIAIIIATF